MVGITEVSAMLGSIKAAKDISEAMVGLRDSAAFQAKAVELHSKIIDAQGSALSANEERATLVKTIESLEQDLARLKAWGAEKKRYELIDLYRGLFAYVPKLGKENREPPHALCANCYQRNIKSILQTNGQSNVHQHAWVCHSCKSEVSSQWRDMGALIKKSREMQAAQPT